MYCASCGTEQDDNSINCTSCGQPLHGSQVQQPAGYAEVGIKPNTFLVPSILVTIFCCQIFGIVAIVYSAIAMGKVSSGDYSGAEQAASSAKMWCWLGFGIGLAIILAYATLAVIGVAAGAAGTP